MSYNELSVFSANLRRRAESAQSHEALELLDSVDETLSNLSGPQQTSQRILRDMATWLRSIESKLAA